MSVQPVIRMTHKNNGGDVRDENIPLTHSGTNGGSDNKSRKDSSVVEKHVVGTRSKKSKGKSAMDPANITTNRSKKAVHWNPKIGKRRHVSLRDMKQEDRDSIWYNKNEDRFILAMAKVTVKMIMRGEPCDDVDFCSRGLEGKVPVESKKRARSKRKVIQAVLMEQELQRLEGAKNPDQLARASFKHTKDLAVIASERGIKDEENVQEYLDDVRTHHHDLESLRPSQLAETIPSTEKQSTT